MLYAPLRQALVNFQFGECGTDSELDLFAPLLLDG
jgi:hypothetical protein